LAELQIANLKSTWKSFGSTYCQTLINLNTLTFWSWIHQVGFTLTYGTQSELQPGVLPMAIDREAELIELFKKQHTESKNEIRELRKVTKEMSDNLVAFTGLVTRVEERTAQMQEFRTEVKGWQKQINTEIRVLEKNDRVNSFVSGGVIRNVEKIAQWVIIAGLAYVYLK